MKNMFDRALAHMETNPTSRYTLNELRKAAGITMRSQYRLSQQLLDSQMVMRDHDGRYRFHDYLVRDMQA